MLRRRLQTSCACVCISPFLCLPQRTSQQLRNAFLHCQPEPECGPHYSVAARRKPPASCILSPKTASPTLILEFLPIDPCLLSHTSSSFCVFP